MARVRILGGGGKSPSQTAGRPGFGKIIKAAFSPRGVIRNDPNTISPRRLIARDPAERSGMIGTRADVPGLYRKDSLTTAIAGANNDLKFEAQSFGVSDITVEYIDGTGAALSVAVVGHAIAVTFKSTATASTAAGVMAAVNADADASALVVASLAPGNTGAGTMAVMAATPLTGQHTPADIGPDSYGTPNVVGGKGVSKGTGNAGTSGDTRQHVPNRSANRSLKKY